MVSYQRNFASTKLWNEIKIAYNLYMMGRPFGMYAIIRMHAEILSYSRATHISWMEDDTDGRL